MKPVDFRNETWLSIQNRIAGSRAAVLNAWRLHGPGTTAEIAERSKISVLTLRPRTNELVILGFICLADEQPDLTEGIYRARLATEHAAWVRDQINLARETQRELLLAYEHRLEH